MLQDFISTHGARKVWPTRPSRPPTPDTPLVEWDPFTSAVLTELGGKVNVKDIIANW